MRREPKPSDKLRAELEAGLQKHEREYPADTVQGMKDKARISWFYREQLNKLVADAS